MNELRSDLLVAFSLFRADLCWNVCKILLVNLVFRHVHAAHVSMETHDPPWRGCFISGEQ